MHEQRETEKDDAHDRGAVAADLRVLVGLRSRTAVRDRVLPALDLLLPTGHGEDREQRFHARQLLIDQAISAISDPAHRAAAAALLGTNPNRWQPLTRRGPHAAQHFDVGWDGYRRRREATGVSLLDETLDALAAVLTAPASPEAPDLSEAPDPPDLSEASEHDEPTPEGPEPKPIDPVDSAGAEHGWRRRPGVLVLAAVVLAAAGLVALLVARSGDDRADEADDATPPAANSTAGCGGLPHEPGATSPGAPQALTKWSDPFRKRAEGEPIVACAGLISEMRGTVYQTVSAPGDDPHALFAPVDPGDPVLLLNPFELRTYRFSDWGPANLPNRRLGGPIGIEVDEPGGMRILRFEHGVMVQSSGFDLSHAVTHTMYEHWKDAGGIDGDLGAPTSGRVEVSGTGSVQEFEGGRIVVGYAKDTPVTVERHDQPVRVDLENLQGRIAVTEHEHASWYVDVDGVRHWVDSSEEFSCVQRTLATSTVQVPSAALLPIPTGPRMRCL